MDRPTISRMTNATNLRGRYPSRSQKISSWYDSICLVTMATAQLPSAFLLFVDETLPKNRQFLNASIIYNYQAKMAKLSEMIAHP